MIYGRQAVWLLLSALSVAAASQAPAARVSGRLITADGRPLLSAAVALAPEVEEINVRPQSAAVSPGGSFSFRDVPGGRYEIRARGQTENDGPTLFGTFALGVGARDISNVEITLREGATLQGRVTIDRARGVRPPPLASIIVRAPLTDGSGFGDALTGRPHTDGSFAIRGLMPGTHHVLVDGLPDTWMVESVRVRGRDVTDAPFAVDERQRFDDVRVVITDAITRLTLHVSDDAGPAPDVAVAVFAASPELCIRGGRRVRLVRTDTAGDAVVAGMPPGAYLAAARRSIDERSLFRAGAFDSLREGAAPFTIAAGAADTRVTLRLGDAAAARR
jgi:hypothetical protein